MSNMLPEDPLEREAHRAAKKRETADAGRQAYTSYVHRKLIFGIPFGFVAGVYFFVLAIPEMMIRDAPVMSGRVVHREPGHTWIGETEAVFQIELEEDGTRVQAITGNYLLDRIPETVRFRYDGDPSREVFLFEHEENPLWIAMTCWAVGAFCALVVWHERRGRNRTTASPGASEPAEEPLR